MPTKNYITQSSDRKHRRVVKAKRFKESKIPTLRSKNQNANKNKKTKTTRIKKAVEQRNSRKTKTAKEEMHVDPEKIEKNQRGLYIY